MSLHAEVRLPSEVSTFELDPKPPFGLVTLRQYAREHPDVWASFEALRWFCRQHRQRLAEGKALAKWRGELCVDPEVFEAAAKAILCDAVIQPIGEPFRRRTRA